MIKRLFGKPEESPADEAPPLPAGRLVTGGDVRPDRARSTAVELGEADIDRIAARVTQRLTHGPMADTVARVVAEVSERLVREEIDRIRAAAQARKP